MARAGGLARRRPSISRVAALTLGVGLLLGLPAPTPAQNRNLRFDRLSLEDGLSQSFVNSIVQDRHGFMWFGTEDGLNRYDGYGFTVFKHDPEDRESLSNNFVWSLLEDRHGELWVGTNGGGLNRWTGTGFMRYRNDPSNPTSLSHDRVRALYEDHSGVLWIGTDGGGLNRFDPESETFVRYNHDPSNPDSLSSDRIRAIFQDSEEVLWIGTYKGGLNRFDAESESFSHCDDSSGLSEADIVSIYEDSRGDLWVGAYGDGLFRLDRETGELLNSRHDPSDPTSLSSDGVRTIFEDDTGTLWVGTEGGLNEWKPETESFVRYRHSPSDPRSLSAQFVNTLYQDRGGVLWIGTKGGGLSKWNTHTGSFLHYKRDPGAASTLSSDVVSAIHLDRHGGLWVGTFGGGLSHLDRATGIYTNYLHDPEDPSSLSDDRVMALLIDRQGVLWVGTMGGGLNRLNSESGVFTRYQHDPADPKSLSSNGIMSLYEDREGILWVGTWEGGLNRFDRSSGTFTHYVHEPSSPNSLASNRVTVLLEDASGVLWVGTDGGGLNRFDRKTGTFAHYGHDPNNPSSLSSDVVWSLHLDRNGVLWVGTQGGGLNRWDSEDRAAHRAAFRRYTERDGLANDFVYGILSDDLNNLWLSTNKGISKLNVLGQTFKNYDTTHGLQSDEFNFGAYYRSADGEMFFGGIKGFNAFYPAEIRDNSHVPPVVLTSFLKLNREADLGQPIWETQDVEIGWRDYVVSFEFAALDYTAPEQNRYAYKLEGFDTDWIDLGTVRRTTYTNLPAGNYTFRVKGSNNDGVWSEEGARLTVRAIPPPWKTWWAYSLYAVAVLAVIFAYVRAQAKKLEREAEYSRKLEEEVRLRTLELAQSNEELQVANKKLQEASLTDSLTGLRNRRFLMTHIQEDLALVERRYRSARDRGERPGSLAPDFLFLMIDLDGLKELNDLHGHAAGDLALLQMRELLEGACRASDTLIRWGGDEFLVVGRGVDRECGATLAERIRRSVESHNFDLGLDHQVHLSCSVGFAFYPFVAKNPTLLSGEQVINVADRGLYLAKTSGRNAWVGILSTESTPASNDLGRRLNNDLEALAAEGAVELLTSIPDPAQVVWDRV